jgi:hypothetical protein
MKIRNGFVSNSSTASFIVLYKDILSKKKPLLSKTEATKLEKKGFYKTYGHFPSQSKPDYNLKDKVMKDYYNYGYDIIVNEFEILEWLLKNKIPFVADCHYDQYTVVYERGSKYVEIYINAGKHKQMNIGNIDDLIDKGCAKQVTIEQFLKEGYYI